MDDLICFYGAKLHFIFEITHNKLYKLIANGCNIYCKLYMACKK